MQGIRGGPLEAMRYHAVKFVCFKRDVQPCILMQMSERGNGTACSVAAAEYAELLHPGIPLGL